MITTTLSELKWKAAQGHKSAQQALAECPVFTQKQRDFWDYKANGGKAFSMDAWALEQSSKK
ncbi:MAG: hypothetical protein BWK73_09145 [Thiothrix lacustris]|uniref:Uncharacterized protein n=1 Tax=Thiothrix lacustris TaxID=525917 RepID=A0A1Y1QV00_9GAMM|nr:MAG: hypothetical protein BWK73_09145 [Thiothrix lacustris]